MRTATGKAGTATLNTTCLNGDGLRLMLLKDCAYGVAGRIVGTNATVGLQLIADGDAEDWDGVVTLTPRS